eukprot:TRINITY_DN11995_c3_g1_i1.p1 TRINITY_DN11995_c3_g1~~TRINITY_DN11995_c3_g1_i1.p1  ORF type:complete len:189 (+),score=55.21 TRINITY_DN11995_c3_g1_i1:42-569(+)
MCDTLNIVLLGDKGVGKTALLKEYAEGFSETKGFNVVTVDEVIDDRVVRVMVFDVCGDAGVGVGGLVVERGHCFVVCFAVDDDVSYESVVDKWVPLVEKLPNHPPIVIACTKTDLAPPTPPIVDQALTYAHAHRHTLLTTTTTAPHTISTLFSYTATQAALALVPKPSHSCCSLC